MFRDYSRTQPYPVTIGKQEYIVSLNHDGSPAAVSVFVSVNWCWRKIWDWNLPGLPNEKARAAVDVARKIQRTEAAP